MANIKLKVDKQKCVQCGRCIHDCICSVLEFGNDKVPKVAKDGETRCMKCQHCMAVCPTGALSVLGKKPEESLPVEKNYKPENVLSLIQTRKSIRNFKQENISKDKWNKIKEMLPWIPTGCNDHRLVFAFIDDIDAMAKFRKKTYALLKKLYETEPTEATQNLFAFKDMIMNGNDVIFRNAPHLAVACSPVDAPCADIDGVIALSYLELYAHSLDVGTLWCGLSFYCLQQFPELVKELKIPAGYKPVYCMLLGNSNIQYKRVTQPAKYKIVTYGKTLAKLEAFANKVKNAVTDCMK